MLKKTQGSGKEEASDKVSPQSFNMSFDEAEWIAASVAMMVLHPKNVLGIVLRCQSHNLLCVFRNWQIAIRNKRAEDQRGLERSHVSSIERLAHGRGVGRHEDEPDVGMRLHMEGQELLTDVHGTHVHEAYPWGSAAIGVHDSGVQLREEGCEGRRRRPVALRIRGGQVRGWWVPRRRSCHEK